MDSEASRTIQYFQRLCDYDIPYCGSLDDGKGTILYVNSDVYTEQYTENNTCYYHKRILLRIDKVTHIVKKGDSLSVIAKKLGVSVQSIAAANGIRDVNMIREGQVLNIDVDIRYGYGVNCMVDLDSFNDNAKVQGYHPLSESIWYKVISEAHSISDNLAESLAKNAGKTRIGTNWHIYVEKPSGRVFRGNQYTKTYGLKDFGKSIKRYTQPKIGKAVLPLAIALEGVEIYDGWEEDGRTFGHNAQKETVGAVGGVTGAAIGAMVGATLGTALFGIGAPVGSVIGGFLGGWLGGILGEDIAETNYDKLKQTE